MTKQNWSDINTLNFKLYIPSRRFQLKNHRHARCAVSLRLSHLPLPNLRYAIIVHTRYMLLVLVVRKTRNTFITIKQPHGHMTESKQAMRRTRHNAKRSSRTGNTTRQVNRTKIFAKKSTAADKKSDGEYSWRRCPQPREKKISPETYASSQLAFIRQPNRKMVAKQSVSTIASGFFEYGRSRLRKTGRKVGSSRNNRNRLRISPRKNA